MSYLEQLLEGVVVEWKPLGDVATITIGEFIHKNHQDPSLEYPVYNGGKSATGNYEKYNNTGFKVIVSARGANAGFVNYLDTPYWAGNSCYSIGVKHDVEVSGKFIFYYLKEHERSLIGSQQTGSIPAVSKSQMQNFNFPIPPLSVQKEIVRILDTFTGLTAELKTELIARKKQFTHYRDQLLSFEGQDVEWKPLGDLTSLITKGTTPKSYTENGISFIKTDAFEGAYINREKLAFIDENTQNTFLKRSILKHNDILITITGATIGKCAIVPKEVLPANTNQNLAIIRLKDNVINRYIYYLMRSSYMEKYIELNSKASAQPSLNLKQISDFSIPIPPIAVQERIVSILDKFDTLANSKIEGLPAEIEMRQKQYEYYRDQLLTFPKSKA